MNVKVLGNKTENMFCEYLSNKGWWVYLTGYKDSGQPCDIIALKGNQGILLDVKHCKLDRFSFNHIQSNQFTCFDYAYNDCDIKKCGFAIWFEKQQEWYWLPYELLNNYIKDGKVSVKYDELCTLNEFLGGLYERV